MRAFIVSLVLLVGISAGAALVLNNLDRSAQTEYSSDRGSVRL